MRHYDDEYWGKYLLLLIGNFQQLICSNDQPVSHTPFRSDADRQLVAIHHMTDIRWVFVNKQWHITIFTIKNLEWNTLVYINIIMNMQHIIERELLCTFKYYSCTLKNYLCTFKIPSTGSNAASIS